MSVTILLHSHDDLLLLLFFVLFVCVFVCLFLLFFVSNLDLPLFHVVHIPGYTCVPPFSRLACLMKCFENYIIGFLECLFQNFTYTHPMYSEFCFLCKQIFYFDIPFIVYNVNVGRGLAHKFADREIRLPWSFLSVWRGVVLFLFIYSFTLFHLFIYLFLLFSHWFTSSLMKRCVSACKNE